MLYIKYTIYDTRYLQLTCLCLHWLWKCFEKYGIMKWIIYLKNGFCQFWWNPSRSSGYKPDINLDQLDSNHIVDWEKKPESLHNRRIDDHNTMYDQKGFICFDLVRHLKRHNVHSVSTVCHVCTVNLNVKRTKMHQNDLVQIMFKQEDHGPYRSPGIHSWAQCYKYNASWRKLPPSFENSVVLHLSKLESPSPLKARMLLPSFFFWIWPCDSGEGNF